MFQFIHTDSNNSTWLVEGQDKVTHFEYYVNFMPYTNLEQLQLDPHEREISYNLRIPLWVDELLSSQGDFSFKENLLNHLHLLSYHVLQYPDRIEVEYRSAPPVPFLMDLADFFQEVWAQKINMVYPLLVENQGPDNVNINFISESYQGYMWNSSDGDFLAFDYPGLEFSKGYMGLVEIRRIPGYTHDIFTGEFGTKDRFDVDVLSYYGDNYHNKAAAMELLPIVRDTRGLEGRIIPPHEVRSKWTD